MEFNSERKIVHIIGGLDTGGAEQMLLKLLGTMDREGCTPVVISLGSVGRLGPKIKQLGVDVHALEVSGLFSGVSSFPRLVKLIREIRPRIIQGWMYHANFVALILYPFTLPWRANIFWSIHSLYNLKNVGLLVRFLAWLGRFFSWVPSKITYVSKVSAFQHECSGYLSSRTEIIPIGFDIECFRPSDESRELIRAELGLDESKLVIGVVGRYDPLKDYPCFINAAKIVSGRHPGVNFVMVGSGLEANNKELFGLIRQAGLARYFHCLGERRDVENILASLDVFVNPSMSEAFPNVVGEAMACGVPCVVTDAGDSSYITGECGKVVPVRSAEDMAEAICEILEKPCGERFALGRRGRQRIVKMFSLQQMADKYSSIYMC